MYTCQFHFPVPDNYGSHSYLDWNWQMCFNNYSCYCMCIIICIGALAHTQSQMKGKLCFGYYDLLQYQHTVNITIDVLLKVLIEVHTSLKCILYLQLDNCWKENKNKFLFGFCALLVNLKVLKKVC